MISKENSLKHNYIAITLFSIAMGLLEAVVVVYLRLLYYPDGFSFPLHLMSTAVYRTEIWREVATLVMLAGVSLLAGKKFQQWLAYFLFSFGIWDIFYYIFLKIFLDWPAGLLDWDILFLIPTTWLGPVLSPVLCSLVMLVMAGLILHYDQKGLDVRYNFSEWCLILGGSLVIFYTYIRDYAALVLSSGLISPGASSGASQWLEEQILQFVPTHYPWLIFSLGLGSIILGISIWHKRIKQSFKI